VKFFIDRDLGKKLGAALRSVGVAAVNHVDRYPKSDAEKVPDSRWIRDATAAGEIILTRDSRVVRRGSAELASIVAAGGRGFVLETGNATPLMYLRVLMIAWPRMERIVNDESAPYMYGITASGRVLRRYPEEDSQ